MSLRFTTSLLLLLVAAGVRADESGGETADLDPGVPRDELSDDFSPVSPLAVFASFEEAWDPSNEKTSIIIEPPRWLASRRPLRLALSFAGEAFAKDSPQELRRSK